jgi:hypothetical protein
MNKTLKTAISTITMTISVAVIALFLLCVTSAKASSETLVEFSNFEGENGNLEIQSLSMDNVVRDDEPNFMVTREASGYRDGEKVEFRSRYFENGCLTYEIISEDDTVEGLDLISPVIYVESNHENVEICLNDEKGIYSFDVIGKDELISTNNCTDRLMLSFSTNDPSVFPYSGNLVVDGVTHPCAGGAYGFDNDTGEFMNGYMIFDGIKEEDLTEDTYIVVSEFMEMYTPDTVSIG